MDTNKNANFELLMEIDTTLKLLLLIAIQPAFRQNFMPLKPNGNRRYASFGRKENYRAEPSIQFT